MKEYSSTGCTYNPDSGAYCVVLTYPDAYRGYPRIWVAEGKHANYGDDADCENGGFGDSDTCYGADSFARVITSTFTNLGSRAHHTGAQDCMPSSNTSYQYYGSGRLECYWTYSDFRGWIPTSVGGDPSTPYSHVLGHMGF